MTEYITTIVPAAPGWFYCNVYLRPQSIVEDPIVAWHVETEDGLPFVSAILCHGPATATLPAIKRPDGVYDIRGAHFSTAQGVIDFYDGQEKKFAALPAPVLKSRFKPEP